jgi:hypothetical protein
VLQAASFRMAVCSYVVNVPCSVSCLDGSLLGAEAALIECGLFLRSVPTFAIAGLCLNIELKDGLGESDNVEWKS